MCNISWNLVPANKYMLKVNNKNNTNKYDKHSNLILRTPERQQWRCPGFFIVNFEHISHLQVFLLLTWNKYMFTGLRLP